MSMHFREWDNNNNNNNNNVVCPFDMRVLGKEQEKIDHYQDLKIEVQKIWSCRRVSIIPIITGALGTVSKNLKTWYGKIGLYGNTALLQKVCFLGTAKILRRVLNT